VFSFAIVLLLLLALLQATVMPQIPLLGVRPDLVLLLTVAWVMVRGLHEGAILAFIGGIVLDLFSSNPLGSHGVALLLTIVPLGLLVAPLHRGNLVFPVAGAFAATILYNLLLLILLQILGEKVVWLTRVAQFVLPLALVHAALMPLAYWATDRLDRRVHRKMRIA